MTEEPGWYFSPRALDCLLAGFMLVMLSQFSRLPLWLSLLAVSGALLGWWIRRRGLRPLSGRLLLGLTLVSVAAFWMAYRGQYTVDTAASFFVLTVALKWLELRHRRDLFVLFFILCYLVTVTLLFRDSILWSLILLVVIFLLFNALQLASAGRFHRISGETWRRCGLLFLRALPVVAILFVFFPRVGPLWSVPLVSNQPTTGLSEEMRPGEITSLAQSSARAFRAEFGGPMPLPSQRYWRALILDRFDGQGWSRSDSGGPEKRASRVHRGAPSDALKASEYEVLMEPSYRRWGYALYQSEPVSANITQDARGLVRFERSVDTSVRYRMERTGESVRSQISRPDRVRYTRLPPESSPRTRAWVAEQKALSESQDDLVNRFMDHFNQQPYHYTLRPAALGDEPVDELLFDTLEGFCEHYASALAVMLRTADIPARIVTGYLGGESGLNNGYLIIRQYDAHAWVEAWLDDYGWVRLDPTAMIAPERIERGLRASMGGESAFMSSNWGAAERYQDMALVNWLRLRADAMNYYWQRWVVGYEGQTQLSLFSRLSGQIGLRELGLITAGLVAALMAAGGLYALWRQRRQRLSDPYRRLYQRWLRWLRRQGIDTGPGDPPGVQAEKAAAALPGQAAQLRGFGRALNQVYYRPGQPSPTPSLLRRQLRRIMGRQSPRAQGSSHRSGQG
ncbi:MAG: DUF3488 and transglutaminase-like domain-containing protein [Oleiphilaceae bacterium]|nr:DUF3488 and transglutaminase-like domain-containing protein [Oleiphilaceae bacterium]